MWLDWLVFDDPSAAPIRRAVEEKRAEVFIDMAGEAELERVLAYDLGKFTLDTDGRAACLNEVRRIARRVANPAPAGLPRCADPADQMFLEAAAAAHADVLVSKDRALLDMDGRLPFRVATPARALQS